MNILHEFVQEFRPEQLKKDFATDAILIPSRWQRYLLNAITIIASVLMSVALINHWYGFAWFSSAFIILVACKYLIVAYRYIQSKEDEQK